MCYLLKIYLKYNIILYKNENHFIHKVRQVKQTQTIQGLTWYKIKPQ